MFFSHISIGGGVTGIETIISTFENIQNKLKKNKKRIKIKKINFAVIDKNPENIPGGVAYGVASSKYGYFNNPIRLSPTKFSFWLSKKENKKKIIKYLLKHGGYTGKEWIKKNKKNLLSSKRNFNELYIPRAIFNLWMEEKLILLMSSMKRASKKFLIEFNIFFLKGEVVGINYQKKYSQIIFKNNSYKKLRYNIYKDSFKKLKFTSIKSLNNPIFSFSQSVCLGLPPPKQLATVKAQKNAYYIWDFYSEGSTASLINKILNLKNKNKILKIYFIGYKAGLLESLPELLKIIIQKKIKAELICSSKDLESIQKAELTINKKNYIFLLLKNNYLKKITTAKRLYLSILKEFNLAASLGYKKYDAWTLILKKKILNKCIKKFNINEKKYYDDIYHTKLRSITRFTYPETIAAKEKLIKMKILRTEKETVNKVDVLNKKLIVNATNKNNQLKKHLCDLVINVSGPLNPKTIKNEMPLVKSLKKNGVKTSISGGFLVNKDFKIISKKNIYIPGILSRGFNPERKTIIKAILENTNKSGKSIAKALLNM